LHDLFQPAFGGFELGLAMVLQRLAALVKGDGILQIDLALLQAGDDGFQLLERGLETYVADRRGAVLRFRRLWNDWSPNSLTGALLPPHRTHAQPISQVWRRSATRESTSNYPKLGRSRNFLAVREAVPAGAD
jgi:autotransporter translocation and assembly factor TamB